MTRALLLVLLALVASEAVAHDPSRALLTLAVEGARVDGRLDISLRDLEDAVGLDADGDLAITWREVQARAAAISAYAEQRLRIEGDGAECAVSAAQSAIDVHGGASYAVVDVRSTCAAEPRSVRVRYGLLFDLDAAHRALLAIDVNGAQVTAVLSADEPAFEVESASISRWATFRRFVREGVWHIWHGYDHLAFVALLMLPIALGSARPRRVLAARAAEGAAESPGLRAAAWAIAGVVTAFTAAHSATLALAAFAVVSVPTRLVECTIALSVLVAALLNVLPRVPPIGAKLAFGFGLVHGLGFASALGDLGARESGVIAGLVGFNVGVELGQLAVVAAALPVLLALRGRAFWRGAVSYSCSAACAALAVVWLAQRLS